MRQKALFALACTTLLLFSLHFAWRSDGTTRGRTAPTIAPSSPSFTRGALARDDVQCSTTPVVTSLLKEPCYAPSRRVQIHGCECGSRRHPGLGDPVTYLVPEISEGAAPLTSRQLQHDVIFVFIHINKAGGTMVKSGLLHTLQKNGWDGAGYGTYPGWQALDDGELAEASGEQRLLLSEEDADLERELRGALYVTCGEPVPRAADNVPIPAEMTLVKPPPPRPPALSRHGGMCPMRVVWGALSLGMCDHFPGTPCVYFTVLREPVERAISDYNYFCVLGREGRHKWTPEWRKRGTCSADIVEWFEREITQPLFLVSHLTRGCDRKCGTAAAAANLRHPCMRYLLLDRLPDGFHRLRRVFGRGLAPTFSQKTRKGRSNEQRYPARTQEQLANATHMARLRALLAPDIELYRIAEQEYESQWDKPLHACPNENDV